MSTPEASINKLNYIIANYDDDLAAKADKEGSYPNLVAGNLYSTSGKTDVTPYLFRETNADRLDLKAVTGGTVAWNQLVEASREDSSFGGLTFTRQSTYSTKISGTANATTNIRLTQSTNLLFLNGHKYLLSWGVLFPTGCFVYVHAGQGSSADNRTACIWACTESEVSYPHLNYKLNTVFDLTYTLGLFDLTQMFGSTIADYIYTLEQNTAGAGVAWFKKLFPKPYYAYDAGSLQSVNASEHKTTGKNLFDQDSVFASKGFTQQSDESWYTGAPIALQAGTVFWENASGYAGQITLKYSYKTTNATGSQGGRFKWVYTDGTTVTIYADNSTSYTTKDSTSFSDKTVASLVWDFGSTANGTWFKDVQLEFGSTATDYVPYESHTYPLDSSLTLRGIPKLDANNNLYYDGDTYESDGKVKRKYVYNKMKLSDMTEVSTGTNAVRYSKAGFFSNAVIGEGNGNGKTICNLTRNYAYNTQDEVHYYVGSDGGVQVFVPVGTANTTEVEILATLATPTEETAEGYTESQVAAVGGTEEFVDYAESQGTRDVAIPVGNEEFFMTPLKEPLEDIVNALPSSDGTYSLKVTMANGVPTFSWSV